MADDRGMRFGGLLLLTICPCLGCAPGGEQGRLLGVTDAHNETRRGVADPTPDPELPELTWSDDLADVAQGWADELGSRGCPLQHSQGNPHGENLAWFSGHEPTPAQVVQLWADEVDCYTFGPFKQGDQCSSACDDSGGCGHYTQLAWRATRRVGCAVAQCRDGGEMWVCNYDPPGNVLGRVPY